MTKKTWIINLIGGPGVGKTTMAALLFANLKIRGYICEYVQEYAKKLVWIKDFDTLNNQYFVTRQQFNLLKEIDGHVDFIVTDGPLIHGMYYNKYNKDNTSNVDKVEQYILSSISQFNNVNIVLDRSIDREYEKDGRIQTYEESLDIDVILRHILRTNNLEFVNFASDPNKINDMIEKILELTD